MMQAMSLCYSSKRLTGHVKLISIVSPDTEYFTI